MSRLKSREDYTTGFFPVYIMLYAYPLLLAGSRIANLFVYFFVRPKADTLSHLPAIHQPTMSTNRSTPGVAGRTDYGKWERLTSDLVEEHERDEQAEKEEASAALGHDRQPVSKAHAEELEKAEKARKMKKMLDKYKVRQEGVVQTLAGLLGEVGGGDGPAKMVTRDLMEAGKRVLTLADTAGPGKIVLTEDLSNLESALPPNSRATPKKYEGDAENDAPTGEGDSAAPRRICGLIKLNLQNLKNCTVVIRCKIITGTIEITNCTDVVVRVERGATAASVQADLCSNLSLEFHDAPSGKNASVPGLVGGTVVPGGGPTRIFWGEDRDDRIYHAGVSNLRVATYRDGYVDLEAEADYKELGAEAIGNATAEEVQFVTSVVDGDLVTDRVARSSGAGQVTRGAGGSARVMTVREVEEEKKRKENAPCPENMIRFVQKNPPLIDKAEALPPTSVLEKPAADEGDVEEVYASMSKDKIGAIVKDCEAQKAQANEAFVAGEYAQAVLLYSLVLDRCAELPDAEEATTVITKTNVTPAKDAPLPMTQLFPRHIILSNRSASFLKLGEHEKALKDAQEAMALQPSYVKSAFRKGLALHAMGRFHEAVPTLGAAHRIEPKNKQIKQALQFAEVRLQQEMRKRMEG